MDACDIFINVDDVVRFKCSSSNSQQVRLPASSVPVKEKNSQLIKDDWKVSASLYRQ